MMSILAHLRYSNHPNLQPTHHLQQLENHPTIRKFGVSYRQISWLSAAIALSGVASLSVADIASAQMPPASGEEYRTQGDGRSESTAALQRQLASLGYYSGEITGYFGPQTREAVVRFQQDMGLVPDGIVGPATAQALSQYGGSSPAREDQPSASGRLPTIRLNDGGEQVAELQRRLADLGYNTSVTGVFDYPTEAAVMQFQRDNGLTPDGIVGPSTEAALRRPNAELMRPSEASPGQNPTESNRSDGLLRLGDTGTTVADLQLRLKELGYYQGEVSGVYGPETEAAVLAFQQSQGLTVDGIAGPQVNSTLFSFNQSVPSHSSESYSGNVGGISGDAPGIGNSAVVEETGNSSPTEAAFPQPNSSPAGSVNGGQPSPQQQPNGQTSVVPGQASQTPESEALSPQALQQLQQAQAEAEQARLEAEQARLEAEQARMVLFQNMDEGRYSVASLQRQLRNQGFDPGNINGVLTSDTQSAILEAQRSYGLTEADLLNDSGSGSYQFPY